MEIHSKKPFQWIECEIVYRTGEAKSLRKRCCKVCSEVGFGVLRSMLKDYEENHQPYDDLIPVTRMEPMLIIDVEEMRVKLAPPTCTYVALSYVWGKPSKEWFTLTQHNSA